MNTKAILRPPATYYSPRLLSGQIDSMNWK